MRRKKEFLCWAKNALVSASVLILSFALKAQDKPPDSNYREACRSRVAGFFLEKASQVELMAESIISFTENNKQLALKEADLNLRLSDTEKQISGDYYSVNLLETKVDLEAQIRNIRYAMAQNSASLKNLKASIPKLKTEVELLRKRLLFVFYFETQNDGRQGSRIKVQYKQQCPRFDEACPLDRTSAQNLGGIFKGYELPPPCAEYMKQQS